ncbi:MAG: hypothetical protein A3G32_04635 [Deltaproteobacteria bacterium RIFCSPLOWO2_12_FULL_40_28]|nr:MAG: hypothetical protein A3C45_08745 [Deltaproteobacteria bacterium RIFCSPHIGHO2_02_FULL_40_28]OGQ19656.1 MAG: hypothetical protein A3E27_07940 [Deltaproteobacteria bacterium RIFCSPHIGHO2_12_FULL_40_32]OGQ40933.1 MAG: hypothetical protein A3I69_03355 [Deltaproteobacteria bacterium RIFCSPLOWO2_02_FULL_40_36]OGQ54048.1 MAG: hypothetical protein A3G32_04635 [Deltaproteobacteria bacterium RIFCSPLOWO2_12_FULL_40_28]
MSRYLTPQIKKDLEKKMVFIGGPRQVGKTTLAQGLLKDKKGYMNWDVARDRQKILKNELPHASFLVLDEIHKYRGWRNYLKGLYDDVGKEVKILVTGSARLDYYRRGGDSLQGRYYYLRLHPFSIAELASSKPKDLEALFQLGGFPEPFYSGLKMDAERWALDYRERLIHEDLSSLEQVKDLGNLELLMLRLPELVSSPLSVNNLHEDLRVNHATVTRWLAILERLYSIFFVCPFGVPRLRAVKKERKHYHYDWTVVEDSAKRFENLVGSHLLKWVHYLRDTQGKAMELCYFRDVYRNEVDFILTQNGKPTLFVECKWSDAEISNGLRILKNKFPNVPSWQLSFQGKKDYLSREGIRVCPALNLLRELI